MNWLKTFTLAAFAVTAPVHTVMLVTGILIFVDLGVGIWRAIKVDEPITSYRLRDTITKLFAYNIVILTSWMIEAYILEGFLAIPAMKIVATFIALTELKSILENISKITGIDFWNAVKDKLQPPKDTEK